MNLKPTKMVKMEKNLEDNNIHRTHVCIFFSNTSFGVVLFMIAFEKYYRLQRKEIIKSHLNFSQVKFECSCGFRT